MRHSVLFLHFISFELLFELVECVSLDLEGVLQLLNQMILLDTRPLSPLLKHTRLLLGFLHVLIVPILHILQMTELIIIGYRFRPLLPLPDPLVDLQRVLNIPLIKHTFIKSSLLLNLASLEVLAFLGGQDLLAVDMSYLLVF